MTVDEDKAGMGALLALPPLQLLSPVSGVGRQELLHRVAGEGLAVDYTFSRQPFSGDPHMVSVHIHFSNSSETPIKGLHVGTPKLPPGISIQEFPEIGTKGLGHGREGGTWVESIFLWLPMPSLPWARLWGYREGI